LAVETVVDWTRHADGPSLHHSEFGLLALELNLQQLLFDGEATSGGYPRDGTAGTRGQEDLVVVHQAVLEHSTPNVTTGDVIADLEASGLVLPFLLAVQRIDGDATGECRYPWTCRKWP
jgi:hypothetical protein